MKHKNSLFLNNKGLTLVEILASVVILAIIFIAIVTILNMTAKSNKTSEDIIDATYLAQQEMEHIYELSLDELSNFELLPNYSKQANDGNWTVYHKTVNSELFLEIKENRDDFPMVRIVVKVFETGDKDKTNPKAQMESLLRWGGYQS